MATYAANSGLDFGATDDADTVYNPAHSYSVQHCHDQFATNGDTITLPTGSFTWTKGVLLSKDVFIIGSGYTANTATGGTSPGAPTLSTNVNFTFSATGAYTWAIGINLPSIGGGNYFRVSGIHFTFGSGYTTNIAFFDLAGSNSVTGSSNTDPYRIDNCFLDGANVQVVMFRTNGNAIGCVIDHCTFVGGNASEMIHNNALAFGSTAGWKDDVFPGTNKQIFIEDCLFELFNWTTQIAIGTSALQSYDGSRTVARYSTFHQCQIDQHGTAGSVGARWFEFYNLTFVESAAAISNASGISCFAIRGGSGFIYNITVNPSNATQNQCYVVIYSDDSYSVSPTAAFVASNWSGISPTSGWCPYGPGQGIFVSSSPQVPDKSSPVYLWNIDSKCNIGTQNGGSGANDIASGRNFIAASPQQGSSQPTNILLYEQASGAISNYNYTPYTYPHPLTGLSNTPGSGLTAVADASITRTVLGVSSGAYSPPGNNYFACFSTQFTSSTKGGATEWSSVGTNYARVAMGTTGSGWSIAAYANGTGVVWSNLNPVATAGLTGSNQTLFSFGFCDSGTVGGGNINFFIDLANQLNITAGQCVVLPAATGAIFTTY